MTLRNIQETVVKALLGNLVTKLMALSIALALWAFAFTFSSVPPVPYSVPVRVAASEGWAVSIRDMEGNERQTVDATVKYPRRFQPQVEQLFRAGGPAYVQVEPGEALAESGPDTQDIKVTLKTTDLIVNRNLGISIIQFHPRNIVLHYVRETMRSVNVIPRLSEPPPDYQAATPYCTPRVVTIRGPKNVVSAAAGIETDLIDISGPVPMNQEDWSLTLRVRLVPYVTVGGQRQPISVSEETVGCLITLTRTPATRTFENIPILLLAPPNYPYVASLREGESTTSVRVSGPAGAVAALKPENIVLFVEVGNLKPSEIPHTTTIEADVVGVPNAGLLTVTPGSPDRGVRVAEPNPK